MGNYRRTIGEVYTEGVSLSALRFEDVRLNYKIAVQDIESGLIPTHIHVTLGTSATAADDHLESIWPVAKKSVC